MRIHNIPLTEAHVIKGHRRSISYCPVALAIKANFKATYVTIGTTEGQWNDEAGRHEFKVLGDLGCRIRRFDTGGEFEAGVYQIVEEV